ncbi:MAG: hypothetical protein Q3966_00440 [Neisseria sp.]|nr:hypothetical protein [Neisseria sp.]
MKADERRQARELLELEIRLARMRVAADYLKQRGLRREERASRIRWLQMAELAANAVSGSFIGRRQAALPPKYRLGMLAFWAVWRLLHRRGGKKA